jgi:hypothetical protein
MANWSNPLLTSTYTNFVTEVKDRDTDLALQFDGVTASNIPTGTIRWNSTANRWQKWNGSSWAELTSTYALTGLSTTGNASIGGTLSVTGTTALAAATATTPATADNSTAVATTAYVRAQGYAALASPALTGTPTAPTAGIGTNTTQLATCAYVNSEIANDALLLTGGTLSGSVTATALIPSGSSVPTNGLYLPSANTVALATASTGRLFVDVSGRVGIGTSPSATLDVAGFVNINGSGSSGNSQISFKSTGAGASGFQVGQGLNSQSFYVYDTAASSERIRIDSSGRVGIGTASPGQILDAFGAIQARPIVNAPGTSGWYSIGSIQEVSGYGVATGISVEDAGYNKYALLFGTRNDGSGIQERMRISAAGNVGIGTTSPIYALDVNGSQGVGLQILENSSGNNRRLRITQESSGVTYDATYSSNGNAHRWLIGGGEAARIDSSGRLGVGTSSPSYTLDVRPTGLGLARIGSQDNQAGLYLSSGNATSPFINFYTSGLTALRATIYAGASSDDLIFGTGASGTERLRIGSAGQLGLAGANYGTSGQVLTSNGASAAPSWQTIASAPNSISQGDSSASITDTGADGRFAVTTDGVERLRVDPSGRLLVGTSTSPSVSQGQSARLVVQGYVGSDTGKALLSLQAGEAAGTLSSVAQIGELVFADKDGRTFASIIGQANGTSSTTSLPGSILFNTTASGTTIPGVRFSIAADGALSSAIPGLVGTYPAFDARVWVNFNGTGTVAIRASGNVSSITDNGVGDYTVNFTTAMPNANYSLVASSTFGSANGFAGTAPTTSAARVSAYTTTTGAALDSAFICVAIFR